MNFFDAVLQAVNTLVQQNLGVFDGMGQNLFRAFATILVVWYGIKAALCRRRTSAASISRTLSRSFCDQFRVRHGQLLRHTRPRFGAATSTT